MTQSELSPVTLSSFISSIKAYAYAELGKDLVGSIKIVDAKSHVVRLSVPVSEVGTDDMKKFRDQIVELAKVAQFPTGKRGEFFTGCKVTLTGSVPRDRYRNGTNTKAYMQCTIKIK